jgi:hypothetical protein
MKRCIGQLDLRRPDCVGKHFSGRRSKRLINRAARRTIGGFVVCANHAIAVRTYIRGALVREAAPVEPCAGPCAERGAGTQRQRLGGLLPKPLQLAHLLAGSRDGHRDSAQIYRGAAGLSLHGKLRGNGAAAAPARSSRTSRATASAGPCGTAATSRSARARRARGCTSTARAAVRSLGCTAARNQRDGEHEGECEARESGKRRSAPQSGSDGGVIEKNLLLLWAMMRESQREILRSVAARSRKQTEENARCPAKPLQAW